MTILVCCNEVLTERKQENRKHKCELDSTMKDGDLPIHDGDDGFPPENVLVLYLVKGHNNCDIVIKITYTFYDILYIYLHIHTPS